MATAVFGDTGRIAPPIATCFKISGIVGQSQLPKTVWRLRFPALPALSALSALPALPALPALSALSALSAMTALPALFLSGIHFINPE